MSTAKYLIAFSVVAVAIPLCVAAQGPPVTQPPILAPTKAPTPTISNADVMAMRQNAEIQAFRKGLEISADSGRSWHTGQIDVVVGPCPSTANGVSPCGPGSPNTVQFRVRFPAISSAIELTNIKGEKFRYYVAVIENLSSYAKPGGSAFCRGSLVDTYRSITGAEFLPRRPWNTQPGPTGSAMEAICYWAVLANVGQVGHIVWSDTVSVRLHGQ